MSGWKSKLIKARGVPNVTQRSIQTNHNPAVIIRAGGSVRVEGQETDRVSAHADGHWGLKLERRGEAIEVSLGLDGDVQVPLESSVKVYTGKSADVRSIRGSVAIYAGLKVFVRGIRTLVHAASGGAMDFECDNVEGTDIKFSAGGDIRCHIPMRAEALI